MRSLLLALTLAATVAPLDEKTDALRARLLGELDRPQAIADLFRLFERRDELGDLAPMIATLERASKSPRARPDVQALALEMRGELAAARGQLPASVALADQVAPIRAWSIVGPFENEGRGGLLTAREGLLTRGLVSGPKHDVTGALPQGLAPRGVVFSGASTALPADGLRRLCGRQSRSGALPPRRRLARLAERQPDPRGRGDPSLALIKKTFAGDCGPVSTSCWETRPQPRPAGSRCGWRHKGRPFGGAGEVGPRAPAGGRIRGGERRRTKRPPRRGIADARELRRPPLPGRGMPARRKISPSCCNGAIDDDTERMPLRAMKGHRRGSSDPAPPPSGAPGGSRRQQAPGGAGDGARGPSGRRVAARRAGERSPRPRRELAGAGAGAQGAGVFPGLGGRDADRGPGARCRRSLRARRALAHRHGQGAARSGAGPPGRGRRPPPARACRRSGGGAEAGAGGALRRRGGAQR